MEQQAVFDLFDLNTNPAVQTDSAGTPLVEYRIATYVCPSDRNNQLHRFEADSTFGLSAEQRFIVNYAASAGSMSVGGGNPNVFCQESQQWNSYRVRTITSMNYPSGPFTRSGHAWTTTFSSVTGGLSNTIFLGEVRVDCSVHLQSGWTRANSLQGRAYTTIPINYDSCQENHANPCRRPDNWSTESGFKSRHPGGANFVFGDGTVHFLTDTIDHAAYQELGDMTASGGIP